MVYTKILFPTSGSPISEKIAQTIANITNPKKANVTLLYVIQKYSTTYSTISSELDEKDIDPSKVALEDTKTIIEKVAKTLEANDLSYNVRVEFGEPVSTILKVAQEIQCELMVIGHHGENKLSDYLFHGNITSRLVKETICPILVVK